jgi:pyridoxamine 5'-phosphate oxidase
MTEKMNDLRSWLRSLPVFPEVAAGFDTEQLPEDPAVLFLEWLTGAAAAGQLAPHAACLSTSGADAVPSARFLILKDLDHRGWHFASHRTSPKGIDLSENPNAAMTFFWPATARQVRVSGSVSPLPGAESAQDFLARPLGSRASALVGRQSDVLSAPEDYAAAIASALARLEAEPESVDADWTLYALDPTRIEFWQASAEREHTRVRYEREHGRWSSARLWP